jgi:hypothetical protein
VAADAETEAEAALEASLGRARALGAALQSRSLGLAAELRHARAAAANAEAVASAKHDMLQVRRGDFTLRSLVWKGAWHGRQRGRLGDYPKET